MKLGARLKVRARCGVALFFLLPSISSWAGEASCPYTRAHYRLQQQPDVTADFLEVANPRAAGTNNKPDLFLHVHIASLRWDYWYLPVPGNGYGDISLISVENPRGKNWQPPEMDGRRGRPHADQTYFSLDKDLKFLDGDPYPPDAPAPYYIFIPDFGPDVWYDARMLVSGRRYLIRRAFFVLNRCG